MDILLGTLKVFTKIFAGTFGILLALTVWGLLVVGIGKIFKKK